MRYLTFRSLKMDKSSLKSSNIQSWFLHAVSRKGDVGNGFHAFMDGQSLPVSIFIGFHGIEARILADDFVHRFVCSTRQACIARESGTLAVRTGTPEPK